MCRFRDKNAVYRYVFDTVGRDRKKFQPALLFIIKSYTEYKKQKKERWPHFKDFFPSPIQKFPQ